MSAGDPRHPFRELETRPSMLREGEKAHGHRFARCVKLALVAGIGPEATVVLAQKFATLIDAAKRDAWQAAAKEADRRNRERGIETDFEARYASR